MLRLRKNHPSFNPRRQRSPVHCYPSIPHTHRRRPLLVPQPSIYPPSPSSPLTPPSAPLRILEFTSLVAACTSTTHQEAPGSKRVPIFSHPLCPFTLPSSRYTPLPSLVSSLPRSKMFTRCSNRTTVPFVSIDSGNRIVIVVVVLVLFSPKEFMYFLFIYLFTSFFFFFFDQRRKLYRTRQSLPFPFDGR